MMFLGINSTLMDFPHVAVTSFCLPGEKGLIQTQLTAGLRLLSRAGTPQVVLLGCAKPDVGQSDCQGTSWEGAQEG